LESERETSIELGWNWFKYHAEQRMTMIRYYLIIIGICITVYFSALKYMPAASIGVSIFAIIVSILFGILDVRTSRLVKIGEQLLAKEQERLADHLGYQEVLLTKLADESAGSFVGSYGKAFRILFCSAGILFLAGIVAAICVQARAHKSSISQPVISAKPVVK
jgi:hypothetical protein